MKHTNLSEQDRQLLLHLHTFVYLHKEFIVEHIYTQYKSPQVAYRRLKTLQENGYLKSWLLPVLHESHRPSLVYTLTDFGVANVEQLRGIVHWRKRWSDKPANWYQHAMMLAETAKAFENAAPAQGLEMSEYVTEQRGMYEFAKGSGRTSIRPDGIVCIGKPETYKSVGFIIEMERSYATKEHSLTKLKQYDEFFSRKEELMEGYKRKVIFEHDIVQWTVIFIGGTRSKTEKLLRDFEGQTPEVPVLVAYKGDVDEDPFGKVYRSITDPDNYRTLRGN